MSIESLSTNIIRIKVFNNKIKNNQVTALHLMVAFLFIVLGLVTVVVPDIIKTIQFQFLENIGWLYFGFGILLLIISIFYNKKIIQTKKSRILRIMEIIALSVIIIFTLFHQWYLPASYCFATLIGVGFSYLWEKQALKELNIIISEKGVFIPKIWTNKKINWQDLNNIILKHNVVTIDCKDNKLIQYNIISLYNKPAPEIKIYTDEQIKKYAHLYQEDW